MRKEIFELKNFNVIQDEDNYYFFRSLEPGDIEDIEKGIITTDRGYKKLRTDRERWEEKYEKPARWNVESSVSLEEMFMHIKWHYSHETNCISLSSNANVTRTYGETYSEKYVMVKVPKKEMGSRVFHAGEYMLTEIEKLVKIAIENEELSQKILDDISNIEGAKNIEEIKEIIKTRYFSKEILDASKKRMKKCIIYRAPTSRFCNYQALNEEQAFEKNKVIAMMCVLKQNKAMKPIIANSKNNDILIRTLGSAFSSSEQIYYGDIEGERITEISKEFVDILGLLQQAEEQEKQVVEDLKREVIKFINEGKQLEISAESILVRQDKVKENIEIEEMHKLTEGGVDYGKANSIVKKLFYLAKGKLTARVLGEQLRIITGNNSKYAKVIEYIENEGFEIEPPIVTRKSRKGYRLSEGVNLNLKPNELELVTQIKHLSNEELFQIIENGGLTNVGNIMNNIFSKVEQKEKITI